MDAQQFLAEFGHIANAPGGVPKLRELILALAVQGRLVEQLESEESADFQIEKIRRAASVFSATGRRKKANTQSISSFLPMAAGTLPKGWVNVPLCDLVRVLNGRAYSKQELLSSGTPVLRVGNLFTSDRWYYSSLGLEDDKYCDNGDLLYAWSASFGPFIWNGEKVIYHYHIWKLDLFSSADLNKHYLYIYLLEKTQEIKAAGHGISMTHMTKERFEQLSVLLPPLEEQSRIIAKVNELIALCDKLETQQQARRKLQNNLRQSTLQAVASATSPHELQTSWVRLAHNFGRLFHAPEDVAEVKSLILDLAIQGLLTDRHFSDEAAVILIERSLAAKRGRLASGEMKSKKPSATDITDVEINIPSHWVRARLEDIFQFIDYRGKTPTKTSSGVVLVTAKNVRPGFISIEPIEFLSESSYQQWMTRGFPRSGDLLITTEAPLGNVARIEAQPNFALAQRVIDLQPFADINTKCAMYFMMSPLFQSLLEENSTGMTAKGIKAGKLKKLLLPIPPKEEQQRIVQHVEELMKICSMLSSQLEVARKQSTRYAVASVASLTGIAIEQEEEPMKAPQTELLAPLRLGTPPDIKAQSPLATILARHNGEMRAKDLWQRFGGEIDAFYAQLKTEVAHGWILEPAPAVMREKPADAVSA